MIQNTSNLVDISQSWSDRKMLYKNTHKKLIFYKPSKAAIFLERCLFENVCLFESIPAGPTDRGHVTRTQVSIAAALRALAAGKKVGVRRLLVGSESRISKERTKRKRNDHFAEKAQIL